MFFKLLVLLAALVMAGAQSAAQPLQLVNAFPAHSFTNPVLVTHAGDGTNRIFVVQQNGLIRVFPNDSAAAATTTYLNITAKLSSTSGEQGLLGLAFHPDYETNGEFYVNYTAPSPLRTVISRFRVSSGNPNRADSLSEEVLLQINQPFSNHNGGMVFFGTDGYLYVSTGDGGSGGDPQNNSQNVNNLLGKLLRINVDTTAPGLAYAIPPDNPFAAGGGRGEIFAWGLRNPWRVSQDPLTGRIWAGDVGQGSWEEVSLIEVGRNYGWRCYEGNAPYDLNGCGTPSLYTFPVKVYSSQSPNPECSVTGGYVYRGQRRPELTGRYIYSDYCSGKIWKFLYTGSGITEDSLLLDAPFSVSAFGVDEQGELYVCNYGGTIHRFNGAPAAPAVAPSLLAPPDGATGLNTTVTLFWSSVPGARNYRLEVALDSAFTLPLAADSLADTTFTLQELSTGTTHFWRVRAENATGAGPWTSAARFTTRVVVSVVVSAGEGWNLLSVPVEAEDWSAGAIFPGAAASVYAFDPQQGYVPRTILAAGEGYWVKYDSASAIALSGGPREQDSIPLAAGWNVIGALSVPVDTATVGTEPAGLLTSGFFGYDGGYTASDSLRPGRGYWVKASGNGTLLMPVTPARRAEALRPPTAPQPPPIRREANR